MELHDEDVVDFLNGAGTVRDGRLIGLRLNQGASDWDVVLVLTFEVPRGPAGDHYELSLWGNLAFSYEFSNESMLSQIAFTKCLWLDEGTFYLSLDPWQESERFSSEKDGDCFRSKSASLTIRGHVG